ncbi:MAG: DUF881 domain-containing protein [Chloroflexota bacterium]
MTDARALRNGLVLLLLPALLFGFLVTAQWRTREGPEFQEVALRYTRPLSDSATKLQQEQDALKVQLADLRRRLDEVQRRAASQSEATTELIARIEDLRAQAGLTALKGEGIVVRLEPVRPAGSRDLERHTCHAPDLTDIVNAAWRGGARAIAINGERMVASSSIYCVGATIVLNGSLVGPPFEVAIVGPQRELQGLFDDPAQLRDLKRRRDQKVVALDLARSPDVSVPAYSGAIAVRVARSE